MPESPKKLSEKERRFVAALLGEAAGNHTKAAILAGYAKASAHVTGHRLVKKAKIAAAIAKVRDAEAKVSIADRTETLEFLTATMRDKDAHPIARLKAADIRNKMFGEYVQRHEHSGVDGAPIQVVTGVPQAEDAHV